MPASAKYVFVILLFTPWLILHEYSPPGFYVDEAAGAAHAICLNSSLTDYNGVKIPLLAESLGGGYTTPTYMYPLALWARVFGNSIFSLRWFSTFIVLLTVLFTYCVGRNIGFEKGNITVLLLAAVCPWAFHLSRMAWDPPMATMLLMGGVYFVSSPASIRNTVLSSIFAVLAMYAYPPFRVVVPDRRGFVLGDNVENSRDSRHFGPIEIDTIIGRPLFVLWGRTWARTLTTVR